MAFTELLMSHFEAWWCDGNSFWIAVWGTPWNRMNMARTLQKKRSQAHCRLSRVVQQMVPTLNLSQSALASQCFVWLCFSLWWWFVKRNPSFWKVCLQCMIRDGFSACSRFWLKMNLWDLKRYDQRKLLRMKKAADKLPLFFSSFLVLLNFHFFGGLLDACKFGHQNSIEKQDSKVPGSEEKGRKRAWDTWLIL